LDRDAEKGRAAVALAQALAAALGERELLDDLIAVAEEREGPPAGSSDLARPGAPQEDV
jgi:hypothetical protein